MSSNIIKKTLSLFKMYPTFPLQIHNVDHAACAGYREVSHHSSCHQALGPSSRSLQQHPWILGRIFLGSSGGQSLHGMPRFKRSGTHPEILSPFQKLDLARSCIAHRYPAAAGLKYVLV